MYYKPIFKVPFNIRNEIMEENRGRDINDFHPRDQYRILKDKFHGSTVDRILHSKHRGMLAWTGMNLGFFSPSSSQPLDGTSLKAYYQFEEASGNSINNAGNVSNNASLGSAADGTETGVTYSQTGKVGNAFKFSGGGSSSQLGTSTSQFNFMHSTTALFTVNCWLKFTNTIGNAAWSVMGDNAGTGADVGMYLLLENRTGTGTLRSEIVLTNGTTSLEMDSPNSYFTNDTNWHMFSWRLDWSLASNNATFNYDGASKQNANKTGTPSNSNSTLKMSLASITNLSNTFDFPGTVDEWSIWNRVLTDAEITTLYNGGNGIALY